MNTDVICVFCYCVKQVALRAVLKSEDINHHTHKQHKYLHVLCVLQVRFLLSPFLIVSVAVNVWITLFAR